ncbi:MAG: hypothetical protein PHW82_07585 [Bacteroidales bacterium]|nr:hypothetical protein [Bacteroidales bacterium]
MKADKLLILLLLLSLSIVSCKTIKDTACENAVPAKFVNMHGLDGCGWAIELENGQKLEPVNLNAFDIEKKDNKKIWITYEDAKGYVSICMIGPMIKIKCISDR